MTSTEQIQHTLDAIDTPICDDCLAKRVDASPRDVATSCQQLADHGDVDREQGTCSICGQAKIVNSPIVNRNVG